MKKQININPLSNGVNYQDVMLGISNDVYIDITSSENKQIIMHEHTNELTEILVVTSYPPRECGIATYSQDLIKSLNNKFSKSLSLKVCAMEVGVSNFTYPEEVKFVLDTSLASGYNKLALNINNDKNIKIVLIQHEFGFFKDQELTFLQFLNSITKPIVLVFHTVLPSPNETLKVKVQHIAASCESIIVMTHNAEKIPIDSYDVLPEKISVIAHGTHLVPHISKKILKEKYGLTDRKVLTTFGLLSSGKSIETTLEALPAIVKQCPEVVFLIIGKTHPEVVKNEGEKYRKSLELLVDKYSLQHNVKFINSYLALPDLLEYLQLTDIYLFTTNDPNQAVSGTFAYAMSCACPIISTPIPHAKEFLTDDTGIIFDFKNSKQLAESVLQLFNNDLLCNSMSNNSLQKIVSTAWENSAVAHAMLIEKIDNEKITMHYNLPDINIDHLMRMTTNIGMIQFSKINQPDIESGYTLDDNARALIAICMHYKLTGDKDDVYYIHKYLSFIRHCQQNDGKFLNYVNKEVEFTDQNKEVNLDDSNGRALWSLGYVVSLTDSLPSEIIAEAKAIIVKSMPCIESMHSTRAMAFAIKGLFYYHKITLDNESNTLIKTLADRLVGMYKHESNTDWEWYEGYLTYANSTLPEAMLYAYLLTNDRQYKDIAITTLNFLLLHTFNKNGIEVISNRQWLKKGEDHGQFGEQPIDVAYTILTLSKFFNVFKDDDYRSKMEIAFNWFLGQNRLGQIIYNPCTGGCYDGLEETHVNLNQGAESTVSYLMARFTIEKYKDLANPVNIQQRNHIRVSFKQKKCIYSTHEIK